MHCLSLSDATRSRTIVDVLYLWGDTFDGKDN
jgi:hypothetical protein